MSANFVEQLKIHLGRVKGRRGGGGGLLSSSPTARLSRNNISRDLRFRSKKKKSANQLVLKQETASTFQYLLVIVMNRYWNNQPKTLHRFLHYVSTLVNNSKDSEK